GPTGRWRAAVRVGDGGGQKGEREQDGEALHGWLLSWATGDTRVGPREVPPAYGPGERIRSYSQRAMAGLARSERARIRRAQAGSVSDLEALFREHWSRAYRAAYLVVHDAAAAEDIAQESFLAAIRALDRFDRRRPFAPWLHRIAVNRAIDWARARALRAETEEIEAPAPPQHAHDEGLLRELQALPPEHRALIVM